MPALKKYYAKKEKKIETNSFVNNKLYSTQSLFSLSIFWFEISSSMLTGTHLYCYTSIAKQTIPLYYVLVDSKRIFGQVEYYSKIKQKNKGKRETQTQIKNKNQQ